MFKIVIAEDEILLQKALQKVISQYPDFEICFIGSNGQTALDYLCTHKVDILITDIRMPSMDGLELITMIKEAGLNVRTIVISGYNDFEYAKHMLTYGASAYILKPLMAEELMHALQETAKVIRQEETQRNILKSYKFNMLQQQGYVHFTDEIPPALLHSQKLFASCISFKCSPAKDIVIKFQFELETSLHPCCCFVLDTYLYTITTLDNPERERLEIVTELQSYFSTMNIQTKIGIGLPVVTMMDIHKSMKQARHALRFYESLSFNEFVDYERIAFLEVPSIPYPLTEEKKLLDSVHSHDPDAVQSNITVLKSMFSKWDIDIIYQFLTELTINCKREFVSYNLDYCNWDEILFQIHHQHPWEQILYSIRQTLLWIQLQLNENQKTMPIAVTVKKYVQDHLKDPISLEEVAAACFLSKSHFCKIFKEETGKTFKSFLNEIRIEHAKTLLRRSSLKNYEICAEIGLEDVSYFNELFKKVTGMTPSEFRGL